MRRCRKAVVGIAMPFGRAEAMTSPCSLPAGHKGPCGFSPEAIAWSHGDRDPDYGHDCGPDCECFAPRGRLEMLPCEFAEVVERGRAWLAVYEPCGTEGCESPTCQLAYALRRAIAADDAVPGATS